MQFKIIYIVFIVNRNRVMLRSTESGNDYINASFVKVRNRNSNIYYLRCFAKSVH